MIQMKCSHVQWAFLLEGYSKGQLEDIQATLEFFIDRRKILSQLDAQIQYLIANEDDLQADAEDAVDEFMAVEKAVK